MIRRDPSADDRDRAISTVLDAAIFLLLVSAAIGLLHAIPDAEGGDSDPDVAAEATTTLATSMQTIEYRPAPGGDAPAGTANRTDRGTIAELLASATVANAQFRGEAVTSSPNYEAAVRAAAERTIHGFTDDVEVQIRTRWRPLDDSELRGDVVVGPSPPMDADVHAATIAVPVGTGGAAGSPRDGGSAQDDGVPATAITVPVDTEDAGGAAREGWSGTVAADCGELAAAVASDVVGTAFPPERTAIGMRVPGAQKDLLEARYDVAANGLRFDDASYYPEMSVGARNDLLVTELAQPFRAVCRGYDSPEAAAERANPDAVLVSVRTWSP